jgi:hypothetical protein
MPAVMSSRAPAGLLWAASGIVAYVPCIYHKKKGCLSLSQIRPLGSTGRINDHY